MEKILFVDDEKAVLDGYQRTLRGDFEVDVALGATPALAAIQNKGPYAVVVSDMRMPGLSGAQMLGLVRQRAPDTVRMLLTGYTDLNAAMEAVNEGNIFRFLTKPCDRDGLMKALTAGVAQYRLVTSERELLEKTLMASVKVLAEVMGATSPEAFGRSMRIANSMKHLLEKFPLAAPWRFEVAATLSQVGCMTLDSDLLLHAYAGGKLTEQQQARFDRHPQIAMDLLGKIPRMEAVGWVIGQQLQAEIPTSVPGLSPEEAVDVRTGAKLLKLAVAYEELRAGLGSDTQAIERLRNRYGEFPWEMVEVLTDLRGAGEKQQLRKVHATKLMVGMLLDQEIRNRQGMLVVGKGYQITEALALKLEHFAQAGLIDEEIMVLVET